MYKVVFYCGNWTIGGKLLSITMVLRLAVIILLIGDISYFERVGKRIVVHYGDKEFTFLDTLKRLEEKLESHGFLRILHGFFANMNNIRSIERDEIFMDNGGTLATSS